MQIYIYISILRKFCHPVGGEIFSFFLGFSPKKAIPYIWWYWGRNKKYKTENNVCSLFSILFACFAQTSITSEEIGKRELHTKNTANFGSYANDCSRVKKKNVDYVYSVFFFLQRCLRYGWILQNKNRVCKKKKERKEA